MPGRAALRGSYFRTADGAAALTRGAVARGTWEKTPKRKLGLKEKAVREARVNGKTVTAGPDSPKVGKCPACGSEVRKRKRRTMDKSVTWFYRHADGTGKECPKRYRFGS